jgi:predicted DNA-binding transcriptional regulator YafY
MASKKKLPQATRADADRRVRQADRLARLLRILEHIQSRGRWTAKNLALEEECSERTIFRSLQTLELAGVPWYFDESEKCYRVRPDYRFPVLNLTAPELVEHAITTGVAIAAGISGGASATTAKLKATGADDTARLLDDANKLISVLGLQMADHSKHHETLRTVQSALIDRKQLVGRYKSPYDEQSVQLRLTPYRLCLVKQAWYLVAAPIDSNEPRTYRIARFKTLRRRDAPASIPDDFDLREHFGDAWTVFRGKSKYQVEIEFSKEAVELVLETTWHATQEVQRLKDGSVRLSFRVDGLDEIVHWVLGWSGRAKVIAPIELRESVVRHLQAGIVLNKC